MEMEKFEETLNEISKPEVAALKHGELLARAIMQAKGKSVVSAWWLSIPVYMLAALLMKSLFMPHTTLRSNLHEFIVLQPFMAFFFFVAVPVTFIIIIGISVRKISLLSPGFGIKNILKLVWVQLLAMVASLLLLLAYFI